MLLLFSGAARAGDAAAGGWTASFSVPASGVLLPDAARDVVIVAAGGAEADSGAAAGALAAALGGARPQVKQLPPPEPEAVADLGDEAIVARAARLGAGAAARGSETPGAHAVVIVRAYPPSAGAHESALVTVYDRRGVRLSSVLAVRGQALEARTPPPEGSGARASEQLANMTAYSSRFIGFRNPDESNVGDMSPFRGIGRSELRGADLYLALGRKDLARSYRNSQTTRYALMFAGMPVSMIVGIVVAVAGSLQRASYECVSTNMFGGCSSYGAVTSPNRTAYYAVGGILIALGPAMLITGLSISPHPVSKREARRLVNEHNRALRGRYNIPEDAVDPGRPDRTPPETALWLVPFVNPGGGGLALGGTF